ncbi:MAG TPA: arginine--tRNA ligase [Candidatus Thermoplasmatota archaeon]|nr:arginine--tRNA ligase [Candidatus Thermoplasmatota archaeon]
MAHDPYGAFRREAAALLEQALHSLGHADAVEEVPSRLAPAVAGKGDFAYPCFPLAKIARKAPPAIAKEIADALPPHGNFEVAVEGGYVNFRIRARPLVHDTLAAVERLGADFGAHPATGERVIVEHTSANPNGPFHVGRARNPIVGDTLARVLRAAGHAVTTEYYVNDMGKQVAILAWGLENLKPSDVPPAERAKIDHQKVAYYQRANVLMEEKPETAEAINGMLKRFEEGDLDHARRFREAAGAVLAGMRESLARLNVEMDSYFWESDLVRAGDVKPVVDALKKSEHAGTEDGAWFIDLEPFNLGGGVKKWFFLRKDGTSLYTTRDLAYHRNKFERADRLVNVLGEDHRLTMDQLSVALGLVGVERRPEVVWISFVSLPEGKMSTRRNRVVFIDDLLDEAVARAYEEVKKRRGDELSEDAMRRIAEIVGIGALRFNISSVQAEKSITFRWEEALNFEGDSAPFVQYAHARAAGILERAGDVDEGSPAEHAETLTHPSEVALVKAVARLPSVVADAAQGLRIHPVAGYAVELANAFNAFYRDCPVASAEDPRLKAARVALVKAAKSALAKSLDLLGVAAPDSM